MSEQHNIFIGWSGQRSKRIAEAMHAWLPLVLQAAKPWMSTADIEKGSRGLNEVSSRLLGMKVGIIFLTPENLNAPWILYEAGALSKTIDDKTRLCTYLLGGLQFQDVKPPLSMFQATNPDKQDTRKLVGTINASVSDDPVPEPNLDRLFERMWPDLDQQLTRMPKSEQVATAKRSLEDMVTEILQIARAEANSTKSVQAQISHVENILNRAPFGDFALSLLETPAAARLSSIFSYPPVTGHALVTEAIPIISSRLPDLPTKPEGVADASRSKTKSEKDRTK